MSVADKITELDGILSGCVDGKAAIAQAITAKGVATADDDSFDTMALNVGLIEGGGLEMTYVTTIPVTWANSNLSNVATLSLAGFDYDCIILNGDKGDLQSVWAATHDSATVRCIYARVDSNPLPNTSGGMGLAFVNTKSAGSDEFTFNILRMGGVTAAYFPSEVKVYVTKFDGHLFPYN